MKKLSQGAYAVRAFLIDNAVQKTVCPSAAGYSFIFFSKVAALSENVKDD